MGMFVYMFFGRFHVIPPRYARGHVTAVSQKKKNFFFVDKKKINFFFFFFSLGSDFAFAKFFEKFCLCENFQFC